MFTGLVEALGSVRDVSSDGTGTLLRIEEPAIAKDLPLGASVAVVAVTAPDDSVDYTRRIALYREVQRVVMDDAPWITQHNHVFERLSQAHTCSPGTRLTMSGATALKSPAPPM